MKRLFVIGNFLAFIFIGISFCRSQDLISTAGDVYSNASLQLEWSLGETVIETFTNEEIFLTQGFHQPIDANEIDIDNPIKVYPNPFDLNLIIEIQELESENVYALMFDMSGKIILVLHNLLFYNDIQTADMPDGAYLLQIFDSHTGLLKTVKLIKLYQL